MMRDLAGAVVGAWPAGSIKNIALRLLGHDVHGSARISPCLIWRVGKLHIGAGTSLGAGNILRDLKSVVLDRDVVIGRWNWISSARAFDGPQLAGSTAVLSMAVGSSLTSRHYVDCSGCVSIGEFATVAGVRSTFISHQIDVAGNEQTVASISVGDYCLVSSNVNIAPGAHIPPHCLVAMGATVVGTLEGAGWMYAGTPAKAIKRIETSGYFTRRNAVVLPRTSRDRDV